MMTVATQTILLLDGPISVKDGLTKKQRLSDEMAQLLLKADSWRNEHDAWRTLAYTRRWSTFDIECCLDNARQIAMQETVAEVMEDRP